MADNEQLNKSADDFVSAKERLDKVSASVENADAVGSPGNRPVVDSGWIRQSFLVASKAKRASLTVGALSRRELRQSGHRYWDTTLGGYRAINPIPQLTRYADIKSKTNHTTSRGMGRYYGEAYDASAQIIHMRFGVPEYNSLSTFLSGMYNGAAGKLARTGETESLLSTLAGAATYIFTIPLQVLTASFQGLGALFTNTPYNKFYYSKPTMPLYYNAVNTMLQKLAVNMKLITEGEIKNSKDDEIVKGSAEGEGSSEESPSTPFTVGSALSHSSRVQLHNMMPDIFDVDTGFDIYRISTRFQSIANQHHAEANKLHNSASSAEAAAEAESGLTEQLVTGDRPKSAPKDIRKLMEVYYKSGIAGKGLKGGNGEEAAVQAEDDSAVTSFLKTAASKALDVIRSIGEWFSASYDILEAEILGGSQWVSFKVDSTGSLSESFSNSTAESSLASSINSASSGARSAKYNLAGGNIASGAVAGALQFATGAVAGAVSSVGSMLGLGGFGAVMGGGFVDIPKYWENSTSSMSKGDYTIKLRALYGNKLSIFKDVYIPMCMLLGAALPMSTDTNTYTSPFLVELFDKGKVQTRLGMIDNLSITRGTGNLGWSTDGLPTGIDISFSVVDLSTVMHMPIEGESLSFNDYSVYQDYFAALGGLGALEQITVGDRFKRKKKLLETQFNSWWSVGHFSNWAADTAVGRVVSGVRRNGNILTN